MDYKKALDKITQRRLIEKYQAQSLFDTALIKNDELYKTEQKIRKLNLLIVKNEKIDSSLLATLENKKNELLNSMGLTEELLFPKPHCEKCGDTGLNEKGAFCGCVRALALNSDENIKIPLNNFSDSDVSFYEEEHKNLNEEVFSFVKKIIEQYPDNKKRNITINGPTGTGKTFLAGCAASLMLEKGYSVVAITSFEFVNRMLAFHTTFDEKKLSCLQPVLDCNLLIIDDLGTESILKNITLEYLYTVINERMYSNKLTMLTTNLGRGAILDRYGERIYSRLFDKVLGYSNMLYGSDVRLKKRK